MSQNYFAAESLTDADLLARVRAALSLRLRGVARHVQVVVQNGLVTLQGDVTTFFDRQLACESSRRVPGVQGVKDEIQVIKETRMLQEPAEPSSPWLSTRIPSARIVTALILFSTTLVGCGGDSVARLPVHPVEGEITWNGQPLPNALVALHPKAAPVVDGVAPQGQTDVNGKFRLTTYDANDGAPEGEYAVTVTYYQLIQKGESSEPGPNVLSSKLALPTTTDIVVKVAAGPNKLSPIEVQRK